MRIKQSALKFSRLSQPLPLTTFYKFMGLRGSLTKLGEFICASSVVGGRLVQEDPAWDPWALLCLSPSSKLAQACSGGGGEGPGVNAPRYVRGQETYTRFQVIYPSQRTVESQAECAEKGRSSIRPLNAISLPESQSLPEGD